MTAALPKTAEPRLLFSGEYRPANPETEKAVDYPAQNKVK